MPLLKRPSIGTSLSGAKPLPVSSFISASGVALMNGRMLRLTRGGIQNTSTRTPPRSLRTRQTTPWRASARLSVTIWYSASGMTGWLAADQTSPSQAAERNEELLRLADALTALPEPMREVVVLKHLRGWTLQRIAEHLGRTVPAVASLLRRGLEDLRHRLAPEE